MGSTSSSAVRSTELVDTTATNSEDVFKVDNINSHGRKHASAQILLSSGDLCIRQKHRESLHIPLETIKRYGLDGSIFILECGRRAPLGQARYAFRCKHAPRLVNNLDQRITTLSKQLTEQAAVLPSSSTFTNVSSASQHNHRHHHHHRRTARQRRRAQSDQGLLCQTPSSILVPSTSSSSSLSALSLNSATRLSCRHSELNLSGFDLPLDAHGDQQGEHNDAEERGAFIAKLKQPMQREKTPELNYIEFKATETDSSRRDRDQRPISQFTAITHAEPSRQTPSYAYIDHEKTITLKEIAEARLQQQHVRHVES